MSRSIFQRLISVECLSIAVAQPADRREPPVCDGLGLKRSWDGEVRNVSRLVAIGVNDEGFREVLAVAEGSKEDI
jgi:transposase-like protein